MSTLSSHGEFGPALIATSAEAPMTMNALRAENLTPTGAYPIKLLRLPQVMEMTGLRKTKIYELHAQGAFPRRIQITAHSVGWVEAEVQAWLARRVENSTRATTIPSTER